MKCSMEVSAKLYPEEPILDTCQQFSDVAGIWGAKQWTCEKASIRIADNFLG